MARQDNGVESVQITILSTYLNDITSRSHPGNTNMSDPQYSEDTLFPPRDSGIASVVWRPHQHQLLKWFHREAPSLAEPYKAAVNLMTDYGFPARVHLICHIVRDIYNKLPEALDSNYRRREANEINDVIDEMARHWKPYTHESLAEPTGSSPAPDATSHVSVSVVSVRKIGNLLDVRRALKEQPTSAEVLARALYLRFVESGITPPMRLIRTFEVERKWFIARAHLVRDSAKSPSDDDLDEHFEFFERTLHSLVAPHFAVQQELNDILQQANQ